MHRRESLTRAVSALSALGVGLLGQPFSAHAASSSPAKRLYAELATALRSTANAGCVAAAARLEVSPLHADVRLHLRSLGLSALDAGRIAAALGVLTEAEASRLISLSLSYNPIGDPGTRRLAEAMPVGLRELGLVGCEIGDAGGAALLEWVARARGVQMLCIESNAFSNTLRGRFLDLGKSRPGLSIYV